MLLVMFMVSFVLSPVRCWKMWCLVMFLLLNLLVLTHVVVVVRLGIDLLMNGFKFRLVRLCGPFSSCMRCTMLFLNTVGLRRMLLDMWKVIVLGVLLLLTFR